MGLYPYFIGAGDPIGGTRSGLKGGNRVTFEFAGKKKGLSDV